MITFFSFALQNGGGLSRVLFFFGLAGENNVGAWWSGMLLLLGGVFAYDGYCLHSRSARARFGWLMLSIILIGMSFDEIGSVHEHELVSVWVYGAVGLLMLIFSITMLALGHTNRRSIGLILLSFALFGTIAAQENLEHALTWNNKVLFAVRTMIEEGTEIVAMLLIISVTSSRTLALVKGRIPDALALTVRLRRPLIYAGIILVPGLAGATFVLPYPGGPASWLASSLYLLCALAVARGLMLRHDGPTKSELTLFAVYISASAMSSFVRFTWDIAILGVEISVHALSIFGLVMIMSALMKAAGRETKWINLRAAAVVVLVISWWSPDDSYLSQFVWCLLPSLFALWVYAIESRYWTAAPVLDDQHMSHGRAAPETSRSQASIAACNLKTPG